MAFYVKFVSDDEKERFAIELPDKAAAMATGKAKQAEYKAAGKHGIITAYEISTERGTPMEKCTEFWEV